MIALSSSQSLSFFVSSGPNVIAVASYCDKPSNNVATQTAVSNGNTPVDIVSAPAGGTTRIITSVTIFNGDPQAQTTSVMIGGFMTIQGTLASAATLQYSNDAWATVFEPSAIVGQSGQSGVSGFSGNIGPIGGSGQSGLSGISGASGLSGWSSFSGLSGTSGFSGLGYSGESGWSGVSGAQFVGSSGMSGTSGFSGQSGQLGTSGTSGYSGKSGASGASGYSGISGVSGWSSNSGYSGTSGFSGQGQALYANYTSVAATGTSACNMHSYTVPANLLIPGQYIELHVAGSVASSGYSGISALSVAGTQIFSMSTLQYLEYCVKIVQLAHDSQQVFVEESLNGVTQFSESFDETTAWTIQTTGQNVNASYPYSEDLFEVYLPLQAYLGISGLSGTSGYSGVGTSGYSGVGTSGYSGYSGISGTSGYSGFVGTSGSSGASGAGTSGYSGATGAGTSGYSGYSGTSGYSGYSSYSGYSGTSGAVGTSGVSGFTNPVGQLEETVNPMGSVTGAQTVNLASGNIITATLTGSGTWGFSNGYSGRCQTIMFILTNAGTNITWSPVPKWPSGTAPTMSASGTDIIMMTSIDGFLTNIYGTQPGKGMA